MEVTRVLSRVLFAGTLLLTVTVGANKLPAQSLDKVRLGYSGTGINNYVLEMGRRQGIFRKNGLDLEVVYVNSGSLLSQALIAGTFDLSMSQGSEAMIAKLRGADVRIVAVIANRFNHVYLTAPSITSFKQLKGKKVAVSRFGSGSHFQTNLALKDGGLDPEKDVTILQIGNSGARITAILSGVVDGTIMAADFVPKAKREGFNVLADLADTKIEYPFLSLNMLGSYIDKNLKLALMRSIRVLDRRPFPTPAGIKTVLDEIGSEVKGKTFKFEDFVDLRALRELEKEGAFKQ